MYEGNAMTPTRGFFSVIQFCPDLDRGEYANVGIVLVVPQRGILDIRLSEDNEGPKQRFGVDAFDDARLSVAKKGLAGRIREEGRCWSGAEDLIWFGQKEGNNLTLSPPRVILVENASAEMAELYQRLVHVEPIRRRRRAAPDLAAVFEARLTGVPLIKDYKIDIPEYGTLKAPFAYKNGALNLIRTEAFSENSNSAEEKGNDLAVKGHVLRRYSEATGKPQRLIVVGGFDPSAPETLKRRIEFILEECDARLVREEQLDDFVEEIRREAHS
jgi:hypothetical protein